MAIEKTGREGLKINAERGIQSIKKGNYFSVIAFCAW
jgi:hypothetical protein